MSEPARKLASIQKITEIVPIEGADNIELAKVLSWQCVVAKKDGFKVGDLVIYFEIDSLLPERPEFEFMRQRKFRIRTIKLRGQYSQGLVQPLSILPEKKWKEDEDVSSVLDVSHYDPESPLHKSNIQVPKTVWDHIVKFLCRYKIFRKVILPFIMKQKGRWPEGITHTDEENIQKIFNKIKAEYGEEIFYVSEKVDYQSGTYFIKNVKKTAYGFPITKRVFSVCSRTQWKKKKDNSLWWTIADKYNLETILRFYPDKDLVIQGEQGSMSVQKNKYEIKEPTLWVFSIFDTKANYHYNLDEMETFCKDNGLQTVPILDRAFKIKDTVGDMLEYSKGKSVLNPKVIREGVVIRLIKDGKKLVSFKVKNPDFLIKYEE